MSPDTITPTTQTLTLKMQMDFIKLHLIIIIPIRFSEYSRCFSTNGTNKRASLAYCWHAVPIMTVPASPSEVSFIKLDGLLPALWMDGRQERLTEALSFFSLSVFLYKWCHTLSALHWSLKLIPLECTFYSYSFNSVSNWDLIVPPLCHLINWTGDMILAKFSFFFPFHFRSMHFRGKWL